ncbi:MAG: hypothetical protein E6J34_09820 [Chloroflexi bacterium]|nr:MAG: hypothetical protein E6J34_09820 [Chloroflexota bacterium]
MKLLLGFTSLLYILTFLFLLRGDLIPALCAVAVGSGCCSLCLAQLRKRGTKQQGTNRIIADIHKSYW